MSSRTSTVHTRGRYEYSAHEGPIGRVIELFIEIRRHLCDCADCAGLPGWVWHLKEGLVEVGVELIAEGFDFLDAVLLEDLR